MIIPFDLAGKSPEEILQGYIGLGFDQATAEAYMEVLEIPLPPESRVVSTATAKAMAEESGHAEFLAEITKSIKAGVVFVKMTESDDGLVLSTPTDVGVSWFPGEGDSQVRLVSLGKAEDFTPKHTRAVVAVANEVASRHTTLVGVTKGRDVFIPGLAELQADLVKSLGDAGLDAHPVTLAMADAEDTSEPVTRAVTELTAVVGPYAYAASIPSDGRGIAKADEEKRFSLAPMYIPGRLDSQGDWSDAEELQKAVWKFSRGDKLIALQHKPEAGPVGEAVEMMVIPWIHTVPMFKADGTSEDVTFPAGTPWLGVVWDKETWPLVKSGAVRGYSIGGRANLLNVELPTA